MSERLELGAEDRTSLEARIDRPEGDAIGVVVFCHAHPLQGGTMNSPLMIAVTQTLVERGHVVLRFNFRGTGASEGSHSDGEDELMDVTAAVAHARGMDLPVGLAGWSFGAGVALNWLAENGEEIPYVGIAPPPSRLPDSLPEGPKRIVVGSREQVIDADALVAYAKDKGIDVVITPGDHFFHGRGKRIGVLVAQGFKL